MRHGSERDVIARKVQGRAIAGVRHQRHEERKVAADAAKGASQVVSLDDVVRGVRRPTAGAGQDAEVCTVQRDGAGGDHPIGTAVRVGFNDQRRPAVEAQVSVDLQGTNGVARVEGRAAGQVDIANDGAMAAQHGAFGNIDIAGQAGGGTRRTADDQAARQYTGAAADRRLAIELLLADTGLDDLAIPVDRSLIDATGPAFTHLQSTAGCQHQRTRTTEGVEIVEAADTDRGAAANAQVGVAQAGIADQGQAAIEHVQRSVEGIVAAQGQRAGTQLVQVTVAADDTAEGQVMAACQSQTAVEVDRVEQAGGIAAVQRRAALKYQGTATQRSVIAQHQGAAIEQGAAAVAVIAIEG